jgi:hypothetical protein
MPKISWHYISRLDAVLLELLQSGGIGILRDKRRRVTKEFLLKENYLLPRRPAVRGQPEPEPRSETERAEAAQCQRSNFDPDRGADG